MTNDSIQMLHRIQNLEASRNRWNRIAIAVSAVALLTLVGWAPITKEEKPAAAPFDNVTPSNSKAPVGPAPRLPTDASDAARLVEPREVPPESQTEEPTEGSIRLPPAPSHREGDEPFVPTRLDWLALNASAKLSTGNWDDDGYMIMYASAGTGTNTLRMMAVVDPKRVNREKLEQEMGFSSQAIYALASHYGWSWLMVREETKTR